MSVQVKKEHVLITIILLIATLIEYFSFKFWNKICFNYTLITLLFDVLFHFFFLRFIAQTIIFIGGFKPFLKYIEYQFYKMYCYEYDQTLLRNINTLNDLKTDGIMRYSALYYYNIFNALIKRFAYDINVFEYIMLNDKLSTDQQEFFDKLTEIKKLTQESRLLEDLLSNSEFEKDKNLDRYILLIQEQLSSINKSFSNIKELSWKDTLKLYLKEKCLGSFRQTRAELLLEYECEDFNIKGNKDKSNILGNIIKSTKEVSNNNVNILSNNSNNDQSTISTSRSSISNSLLGEEGNNNKNIPIVILCCGNGVPFEYFHKNRFWLNFYINQNINVCLWNYKGYGLSKGKTSFSNMRDDVESVYLYLKEVKKYRNIMTHGISLGGVPACHLASKYELKLVIADRTFSNMETVIKYFLPFGSVVKTVYQLITFYNSNSDNSLNYYNSTNNKVLLYDSKDQIINEGASLLKSTSDMIFEDMTATSDSFMEFFFNTNEELERSKSVVLQLNQLFNSEIKQELKDINNSYINLDESYVSTDSNMMDELNESYDEKQIQSALRDIFSSYSDLYDVLKSSDFRIERFEVFMKYLFIWGCNTERKNPHSLVDAGNKLYNIVNGLRRLDRKINRQKGFVKELTNELYLFFNKIKNFYFEINLKISDNKDEAYEVARDVSGYGDAVIIRCGHNGVPSGLESIILQKSIDKALYK